MVETSDVNKLLEGLTPIQRAQAIPIIATIVSAQQGIEQERGRQEHQREMLRQASAILFALAGLTVAASIVPEQDSATWFATAMGPVILVTTALLGRSEKPAWRIWTLVLLAVGAMAIGFLLGHVFW